MSQILYNLKKVQICGKLAQNLLEKFWKLLSLYSTAMPPSSRWCLALGNTPTYNLVTYTNMLVSKNTKICVTPDAKHKICITPKAKPQRKSVEYRLRWVPNSNFLRWPSTFFGVYFIRVGSRFSVEYGLKFYLADGRPALSRLYTQF